MINENKENVISQEVPVRKRERPDTATAKLGTSERFLVKKISNDAVLPKRGSAKAAGYDLSRCVTDFVKSEMHEMRWGICTSVVILKATAVYTCSMGCHIVPARGRAVIPTGLQIAIPSGTYARIAPRSGLAVKAGITTGAGVVDEDYRGEVGVVLFNLSDTDFEGVHIH